jgi:hypothetical protein
MKKIRKFENRLLKKLGTDPRYQDKKQKIQRAKEHQDMMFTKERNPFLREKIIIKEDPVTGEEYEAVEYDPMLYNCWDRMINHKGQCFPSSMLPCFSYDLLKTMPFMGDLTSTRLSKTQNPKNRKPLVPVRTRSISYLGVKEKEKYLVGSDLVKITDFVELVYPEILDAECIEYRQNLLEYKNSSSVNFCFPSDISPQNFMLSWIRISTEILSNLTSLYIEILDTGEKFSPHFFYDFLHKNKSEMPQGPCRFVFVSGFKHVSKLVLEVWRDADFYFDVFKIKNRELESVW